MDAPTYPPAMVYQKPAPAPFEFGVETVSLQELLSAPATRAIVFREIPQIEKLYQSPRYQLHISNFTLRFVAAHFKGATPEQIRRVDEQLRALPADQRPAL